MQAGGNSLGSGKSRSVTPNTRIRERGHISQDEQRSRCEQRTDGADVTLNR
jgi:hypothetical protein